MAQMNFGGVIENVMTREEFPLEKAREVLKDETIAVIGYGVQGPGQSLNLRDNGFNVIVGQRQGKTYDKAVADGWVPGETLFSIEEACQKATIIMCLLSDAAVISVWPTIKPCLTAGKALYFSHGFAITWNDRTGVVPPTDVDVIMVAPKGSGTSLRTMFLEGRGLNSSYAIYQDATGKAYERTIALGIGIGSGYLLLDNPSLTVREWYGQNPLRLVIDRQLTLPPHLHLFDGSTPTLVFTEKEKAATQNLTYVTLDFGQNILPQIMQVLYEQKIQTLLIEGGSQTLQAFLEQGLWDEAFIEHARVTLHDGIPAPLLPHGQESRLFFRDGALIQHCRHAE